MLMQEDFAHDGEIEHSKMVIITSFYLFTGGG